jgi:hypothetical protein
MKNLPGWLLAFAALVFAGGVVSGEEELAALAVLVASLSLIAYVVTLRARVAEKEGSSEVERRLGELERRLGLTEGELDVANEQLQRLRAEREFDRALAAGPPAVGNPGTLPGPR